MATQFTGLTVASFLLLQLSLKLCCLLQNHSPRRDARFLTRGFVYPSKNTVGRHTNTPAF
ncbi:putative signal peptide protein [Puccinia sorghi]|uniref:Putative signal peptide protein n=1 Tax=Puccinia sorghi TaxID=27349 RepID=A0A0L6U894_9BASI|nr:putative signal peptide protein [Puccinia sorghi]